MSRSRSNDPKRIAISKAATSGRTATESSLVKKLVPKDNKRLNSGGSGDSSIRTLSNKLDRKHFPDLFDANAVRLTGKGVDKIVDASRRVQTKRKDKIKKRAAARKTLGLSEA